MGTYNTLQTNITCPHCNTLVNVEIEMFFGNIYMMDKFVVGDQYKWVSGKAVQNGGRPEKGNIDGEGYTECPNCRRDFFVKIMVREDRIEGARPDTEKVAYIQSSDMASTSPPSEMAHQSTGTQARKPKPRVSEAGQIIYNEKWNLTARIKDLLEQLIEFGVDISSTEGGSDFTFLVPHGFSLEQQEEIDELMKKVAKEVKGKVNHIDWYPHGHKFRIYPHEGKKLWLFG